MLTKLILSLIKSDLTPPHVRKYLCQLLGMQIADGSILYKGCEFSNPDLSTVTIGTNSFLNENCYFENNAPISIGNNVAIAMWVKFITTTHEIADKTKRVQGIPIRKGIKIGDGCWIGADVTILPGVSIGEGTVIAAGSVVTTSCMPNSLYAGIPARLVKALYED